MTVISGNDYHHICLRASHFFKRFRVWLLSGSRICPFSYRKPHFFVSSSRYSCKNTVQDKRHQFFLTDFVLKDRTSVPMSSFTTDTHTGKRGGASTRIKASLAPSKVTCVLNFFVRLQLYIQPLKQSFKSHSLRID